MHTFSDMEAREASGPGALDHHAMVCSCGYEATSTMPSLVIEYARGHLAWEAGRAKRLADHVKRTTTGGRDPFAEAV